MTPEDRERKIKLLRALDREVNSMREELNIGNLSEELASYPYNNSGRISVIANGYGGASLDLWSDWNEYGDDGMHECSKVFATEKEASAAAYRLSCAYDGGECEDHPEDNDLDFDEVKEIVFKDEQKEQEDDEVE